MEKLTGLYGGTFDPPHMAHLMLAEAFLKEFAGSHLIVMPCNIPPHKLRHGGADGAQRLEMTRLCFEGLDNVSVSDYELGRSGPSYTYLTVKHLTSAGVDGKICLIIGQDNLMIMEKWKEYRFLLDNCAVAVAVRGDCEQVKNEALRLKREYGADIRLLKTENLPLSSTEIREAVANGRDVSHCLTEKVYGYIKREGLYLE